MTHLDLTLSYTRIQTSDKDLEKIERFIDDSRVVVNIFYIERALTRAIILLLTSQGLILRLYSIYQPLLKNLSFYSGLSFLAAETVLSLTTDPVRELDKEIKDHINKIEKSRVLYLEERKKYYKHYNRLKSMRGGNIQKLKSISIKEKLAALTLIFILLFGFSMKYSNMISNAKPANHLVQHDLVSTRLLNSNGENLTMTAVNEQNSVILNKELTSKRKSDVIKPKITRRKRAKKKVRSKTVYLSDLPTLVSSEIDGTNETFDVADEQIQKSAMKNVKVRN